MLIALNDFIIILSEVNNMVSDKYVVTRIYCRQVVCIGIYQVCACVCVCM